MRIYDLLNTIVEKFAPLPKADSVDLLNQSTGEYGKIKRTMEDTEAHNANERMKQEADPAYVPNYKRLDIKQQIVKFCEIWWVRYLFAFISIYLVRKIQLWLTESDLYYDDDDEGDEQSEFDEYLEFKRNKKRGRL